MKRLWLLLVLAIIALGCESEKDVVQAEVLAISATILYDRFEDTPIVLAGIAEKNILVAFINQIDGDTLKFEPSLHKLPALLTDNKGNEWDVFGNCTHGPDKGKKLTSPKSSWGYYFAFNALYDGVKIFEGENPQLGPPSLSNATPGWTIPTDFVTQSFGDEIYYIEQPTFTDNINDPSLGFLDDEEQVVGVKLADQYRLYPIPLLDWHEVILDQHDQKSIAVIYCPLSGTTQIWNRQLENHFLRFGVSGRLYHSNLMPGDEETKSIWTQMDGKAVFGDLAIINAQVEDIAYLESSWATWKEILGDTPYNIVNVSRDHVDYHTYPYGDYQSNNDKFLYSFGFRDTRLPEKERVFGIIINQQSKVYPLHHFQ